MPDNRYVKKGYNMLKMYDSLGYVNWVSNLRKNGCENGFGYARKINQYQKKNIVLLSICKGWRICICRHCTTNVAIKPNYAFITTLKTLSNFYLIWI